MHLLIAWGPHYLASFYTTGKRGRGFLLLDMLAVSCQALQKG